MRRDEDIARAIRQKDVNSIVRLMLEGDPPSVRSGFRTETELWDYKADCPMLGRKWENAWADFAKEVLGFHNQRGGVLIFGIRDDDFSFCGTSTRLDSKLVNDQLRKFLGDRIWVDFHRECIQPDQSYVGLALIPPRGPAFEKFRKDAPAIDGKHLFKAGDSALREEDSTRIITKNQLPKFVHKLAVPTIGKVYEINEPCYRVLAPEYEIFVERSEPCKAIELALSNPRVSVASITGIGGVGKTALATWATLQAYNNAKFEFIVSMTAKDRELTTAGIQALYPALTSFESLLDNILEVLGFPEAKAESVATKELLVRGLIENSGGLLYIDNLETVDDPRIIEFLDMLPVGVRALTTSRRTSVRVSVQPVELGPLTKEEIVQFIQSLRTQVGFAYVEDLLQHDQAKIGDACDGVPIAIRWVLARCQKAAEALGIAESITALNKHGEELLEFCFRRVFDAMANDEKAVLQVLSLFQGPVPSEVLLVGAGIPNYRLQDRIEDLRRDALVQRLFDEERNDYCYSLLPITRAFVYSEVSKDSELEAKTRRKLSNFFDAVDIRDPDERLIIREVRQGKTGVELPLIDLALAAERRGDIDTAETLYQQALRRNPKSWKAARQFAEFHRHKLQNTSEALRLYAQAAANAPTRGHNRSLIYREWGILLRASGDPEAAEQAIEKLEIALEESPHDAVAIVALAQVLDRKGAYHSVIELVEPLRHHQSASTREFALPLLLRAYERTGDVLEAAKLRPIVERPGS